MHPQAYTESDDVTAVGTQGAHDPVRIGIAGLGVHLPTTVLDNRTLARRLRVDEDWILRRTAIRERRIAHPEEPTSLLATRAADQALSAAGLRAEQIDLIALATSTPDWVLPATSCVVQAALGATRAAAFDIAAVCSGFLYALAVVEAAMRGQPAYRNALVIGAETYSKILDPNDAKTCILFGDGAGAAVLSRTQDGGVLATTLHTDGSKVDLVQVPAGGSRKPSTLATVAAGDHYFRMRGRDVRMFVESLFPDLVARTLTAAGLALRDVGLLIPHQANGVILESCRKTIGLPSDKMCLTLERYGNTGAASIPITLEAAVRHDLVLPGMHLLLAAFGGGMTAAGAVVRWNNARNGYRG
jgi:3-oxoacyl-[acyl-carrier-protein] synthase-3